MTPYINMNGDDPDTLLENYRNAWESLKAAARVLRETSPHARNYKNTTDYNAAVAENNKMINSLELMADRYVELAMHIQAVR